MLDLNFLELFIKCNSLDHKNGATERLGSSKLKLIKYPEIQKTSDHFQNPCSFTYGEINKN